VKLDWDVENHGLISQKHRGIIKKKFCKQERTWFLLMQ